MRGFGELESAVMECVWRVAEVTTVRQVLEQLRQQRDIAYTTVMTTMDNLHRKGWLDREKRGKAFAYWATLSREDYSARLMHEALEDAENPDVVLSRFLERMSGEESARLQHVVRRWSSGQETS
ncbi:MAG: BlaI/MecI/CopY family transcriptional regulator [Actinophytocola sp.]|nr:BlaI/MecI/CopY family transcriptional regulator [Actinophytocola sp.]